MNKTQAFIALKLIMTMLFRIYIVARGEWADISDVCDVYNEFVKDSGMGTTIHIHFPRL